MSDVTATQQANTIRRLTAELARTREELATANRRWTDAVVPLMADCDAVKRELALVTAERDRALDLLAEQH